uniref:malic enzyme-like NAD(P)-binding protein n=1 Tax=Bacillus mycoides TaxID=1405 RepID=UPI003CC7E4FC
MCKRKWIGEGKGVDLMDWREGRGLVGTGSAFEGVRYNGVRYVMGEWNNGLIFGGVGVGRMVVGGRVMRDGMFGV